MPKPTMGSVNFTVGPTKKPARLLASSTSELKLMFVTLTPPFKPNFSWAWAGTVVSKAKATAMKVKILFIILILVMVVAID